MDEIFHKLLFYVILIFCITWHECAHALVAMWFGDNTAKDMGRVTLNPLPHLDLFGTIIIPLISIFSLSSFALVGWGKPVLVNMRNFKRPMLYDVITALAGPFSNFLLTLIVLLSIRLLCFVSVDFGQSLFDNLILPLASINLVLCFFNLLPIPPLDGSHLLFHLLPENLKRQYEKISIACFIFTIVLINTPVWAYLSKLIFAALKVGIKYVGGVGIGSAT